MTTEKNAFIRSAEASLSHQFTYLTECKATIKINIPLDTKFVSSLPYQEAMKTIYYIGIAHHSLIIVDFNMLGDVPGGKELGGYLCQIDFSRISKILVPEEEVNEKQFAIYLDEFHIYNNNNNNNSNIKRTTIKHEYEMNEEEKLLYKKQREIPLLIFFETNLREKFLEQYGIAYTTSKMFNELQYIRPAITYIHEEVKPNVTTGQTRVNGDDETIGNIQPEKELSNTNDMTTPQLSKEILSKPSPHATYRYHRLKEYGLYASSHFQSVLTDVKYRDHSIYGWVDPTNHMLNSQRPFFTIKYSEPISLMYENESLQNVLNNYVQRITSGKEYRISKKVQQVQRIKEEHMQYLYEMYDIKNLDIAEWDIVETHIRILGYINKEIEDLPLVPISYVVAKTSEFLDIQDRYRDVVIYLIRRRYIPPELDVFQDIILCYRCEQTIWYNREEVFDSVGFQGNDSDKVSGPRDIMKSLHPLHAETDPLHFIRVAQQQANALMLPVSSYRWYREQLKIEPQYQYGLFFTITIYKILQKYGFQSNDTLNIEKETYKVAGKNPLKHAFALENAMPSVEPMEHNHAYTRAWKRRCWEYLSTLIDEGHLYDDLDLQAIVNVFKNLNKGSKEYHVLNEILDRFVYVRAQKATEYVYRPLTDILRDTNIILSNQITFNVSSMTKLLKNNYLYYIFKDIDATLHEYAQLLTRLLFIVPSGVSAMKNANMKEFRQIICERIYDLAPNMFHYGGSSNSLSLDYFKSGNEGGRYQDEEEERKELKQNNDANSELTSLDPFLYIDIVVPTLIKVIYDCPISLQIQAIKALTKLCSDPKSFLMTKIISDLNEQGILSYVVNHSLTSRDDALCLALVNFLNNLIQNEAALFILVKQGIIQHILDLLMWQPKRNPLYKKDHNPQPFRTLNLLSSSVSILVYVTANQEFRNSFFRPQKNKRNAEFVLDILFSLIHKSNISFVTGTKSSDKSAVASLTVYVLSVLNNLSKDYDKNKKFIGARAIPIIVDVLQTSVSRAVLEIALKLVLSLSLDPSNCLYFRGEQRLNKLYPGLQKLMKGLRRVDPIQIRNFDDILTRCGEIGEFRGIVEEIKSVIYGKK